ncbi:MAG: hypothetical protein ABIZ50_01425 [Solirubrobacterales bacterium]
MIGSGATLASLGNAFDTYIVDAGKLPAFIFLCSFLVSFAFIRTSAHLIRAQVSWWPGNVEVHGTHIHHMFWGILTLMISGWIAITVDPGTPGREILAVFFGVGTGLTLDEFALWLDLRDVYWSKEGRKSIDAVIVAAIIAGFGVLGMTIWVDAANDVADTVHVGVGIGAFLAITLVAVNFLKEHFALGIAGLFIPLIGLYGALRLARPKSPWAKLFYDEGATARAAKRYGSAASPKPASPAKV